MTVVSFPLSHTTAPLGRPSGRYLLARPGIGRAHFVAQTPPQFLCDFGWARGPATPARPFRFSLQSGVDGHTASGDSAITVKSAGLTRRQWGSVALPWRPAMSTVAHRSRCRTLPLQFISTQSFRSESLRLFDDPRHQLGHSADFTSATHTVIPKCKRPVAAGPMRDVSEATNLCVIQSCTRGSKCFFANPEGS